jgi:hypothetical protein
MARRKKDEEEEDSLPKFTTYKFSANGSEDSNLFESVLIGGYPHFLVYNYIDEKLEAKLEVDDDFRILCPPQPNEYSYLPYAFKDNEEVRLFFNKAQREDLDSLLFTAES